MKYTYFIFEVFDQEKRSFFENNSLIIGTAESDFVYFFLCKYYANENE